MAATVKILIKGCTNADTVTESGGERTQPTVTLVRDGNIIMVVDPGVLKDQKELVEALRKEKLAVKDVNFVCVTHSHIDHYRNVGMFSNAKILEYFGLWSENTSEVWKEQFSPNIQVVRTPGHDYTGITLFVTTSDGIAAVCGDIFWKENYPENPQDDAYASDPKKLKESRELVLKMADWIIPGHEGAYKNTKKGISSAITPKADQKKTKTEVLTCKACKKSIENPLDRCTCRPWFCYRCCECETDCDACSCSHKKQR